jgi:hypothetical protein
MILTIIVCRDKELNEVKRLIITLREKKAPSPYRVTVFEAPQDMNYPYPMPVVTIGEDDAQQRLYGVDAVEKLRSLAAS